MARRQDTSLVEALLTGATDRELLQRFAHGGDEEAFAALVRRHGALVLGACRRVLGHAQEAEDAFQATFLLLVKKARSGGWQPSLAGWLYATARQMALNARRRNARQARRAAQAEPRAA